MSVAPITSCPGCGVKSTENYNGDGTCWKCFGGSQHEGSVIPIGEAHFGTDWLAGSPMDPAATPVEPLPTLAGFPFLHPGTGSLIVGPTGGGRSSLVQACLYDAAKSSLRGAYLGSEVTESEFNSRAGMLARLRGDEIGDELLQKLAAVRYLHLSSVLVRAWANPAGWIAGVREAYDVLVMDPLSSVAAALDLDFDRSNAEFVRFYDALVQPLATAGVAVVLVDNVGHGADARSRAKGASAKQDRPDLTFSCSLVAEPAALVVRATKVRSVRAAFQRGDEWIFTRDTQRVEQRASVGNMPPAFRPTVLMERVSRALEAEPGLSKRAIREAVSGRATVIDLALEVLIGEKYVLPKNDGQAARHYSDRPFRDGNDE